MYICNCDDSLISGSIVASFSRVFSSSAIRFVFKEYCFSFPESFLGWFSHFLGEKRMTFVSLQWAFMIWCCLLIFSTLKIIMPCVLFVRRNLFLNNCFLCTPMLSSQYRTWFPLIFLQFEVNDELIPLFVPSTCNNCWIDILKPHFSHVKPPFSICCCFSMITNCCLLSCLWSLIISSTTKHSFFYFLLKYTSLFRWTWLDFVLQHQLKTDFIRGWL